MLEILVQKSTQGGSKREITSHFREDFGKRIWERQGAYLTTEGGQNRGGSSQFFDEIEHLSTIIAKFPEIEQKIVLARVQGYTYTEITGDLGVSRGRISKVLKKLRRIWNED